jgi:hypothetical protein
MAAILSVVTTTVVAAAASVTFSAANSVATGDQDTPAIAANRNGQVAVVWEDDRDATDPADNSHSDVYLRLFRDGAPVFEKKLSAGGTSGTNWKHLAPDVGIDDRGNTVVVWADDPDGNAFFNIPYRVISPAGAVLASGTANASAAGDQIRPRVAVDPDGVPGYPAAVAYTVVWEDVQGTVVTVKAAGFTGTAVRAYEKTVSATTGQQHRPDVAVSAGGDATIVWERDSDVALTRLARANGAVLLSARAAHATGTGQQRRPAIAADLVGDFAVSWESDHTGTAGVWARSFTPAGAGRHAEVPVAAGGTAPTVGVDDQGVAVVGWTTGGVDGWLRGLNLDGTTAGRLAPQQLTGTTAGRQDQFALAVSPWAEVSVGYTDDSDGNLFDQVMAGFGASNNDGDWLRRMAAQREARS